VVEVRKRKTFKYVNDLAGYTQSENEAVFAFTLEELYALESWVPCSDGFHREIVDAITKLEGLTPSGKEELGEQNTD